MFAENDRISHRQLRRQMVLSLLSPLLLCLVGYENIKGVNGLIGIFVSLILLGIYVIFLVRLAPAYENLTKYMGGFQGAAVFFLYLLYVLLTAAYILNLVSSLASVWLLPGGENWQIQLAILLVCGMGSHEGLQKRARMGEVSYWILVGSLVALIVLSFIQGDMGSVHEFFKGGADAKGMAAGTYQILGGFLPLTLLPFLLSKVERPGSAGRSVWFGALLLGGLMAAMVVLLPLILGWERMVMEKLPILPLLTGTNLPGDVLARFDVIWIALLIYGLLYSLGSLFYYASHICATGRFPVNHWLMMASVLLISLCPVRGSAISQYYVSVILPYAGPTLVLITFYVYIWYRRKRV